MDPHKVMEEEKKATKEMIDLFRSLPEDCYSIELMEKIVILAKKKHYVIKILQEHLFLENCSNLWVVRIAHTFISKSFHSFDSISFKDLPLASFHSAGPLTLYPNTKTAAADELENNRSFVVVRFFT